MQNRYLTLTWTWGDFVEGLERLKEKLSEQPRPKAIFGLGRGGLPLATCLSNHFNVELIPISWTPTFKDKDLLINSLLEHDSSSTIWLVDDQIVTGNTMWEINSCINIHPFSRSAVKPRLLAVVLENNCDTAIPYDIISSISYDLSKDSRSRIFPWEK
jgi:hypoxanthine phosphoribosyltransferase